MNFTSTSEIKARVYELYLTEDQELNSNFFNFHVRNLRSTLLKTYAEIQKAINGDAVVLLKKQHRNQAWFRDSGKWNSEFMERNWENLR